MRVLNPFLPKLRSACILSLALSVLGGLVTKADDTGDSAQGGATTQADVPALRPITDVPGLPRVLLIGDSISIGYTLPVRQDLAGVANVHRPPTNCGDTNKGLSDLDQWLGTEKWDVIHFNWGLHDLKYISDKQNVSQADYEKHLRALVEKLKLTGATLIWASTTPVAQGDTSAFRRVPADVPVYNAIAAKVMQENGIQIDDLYSLILPQEAQIQIPRNVHYKPAGSKIIGKQVADVIRAVLQARSGEAKPAAKSGPAN